MNQYINQFRLTYFRRRLSRAIITQTQFKRLSDLTTVGLQNLY